MIAAELAVVQKGGYLPAGENQYLSEVSLGTVNY
jgi:hypothetical protein